MDISSTPPVASARKQEHGYLYASSTNVSNFVSVRLSGDGNYHLWKEQMLCLIKAHDMDDLLMKDRKTLIEKQYDTLLRGWIFGSVSEDVLRIVATLNSAKDVWMTLKSCFDYPVSSQQGISYMTPSLFLYDCTYI